MIKVIESHKKHEKQKQIGEVEVYEIKRDSVNKIIEVDSIKIEPDFTLKEIDNLLIKKGIRFDGSELAGLVDESDLFEANSKLSSRKPIQLMSNFYRDNQIAPVSSHLAQDVVQGNPIYAPPASKF
ncbi:hypothetical protein CJJ19_07975 [Candidatus Williamhamiltonella defendens]|uniref:hypothetical protein n=1 Tax=Candidatus Williamhamiltonella endosymbiont of Tuberolachnus salignus TaxID=3077954 RepID=UPI0012A7EFBC|nr:hypothetical protein [Candidatus Hamiltonella defensa]AYB49411.1 hypothetical protein CJJ19_07975 [Candidatus Hamiltonella defensa]